MPDALTTITNLLVSSPRELVAGGVLFGLVWGSFKAVEAVLSENTKLEIAVWLLGVKIGEKVEPWPDTFAKVFDKVFGERHLTWKCFWRSAIASYSAVVLVDIYLESFSRFLCQLCLSDYLHDTLLYAFIGNVVPDYISLLETRYLLGFMQRTRSFRQRLIWLALDFVLTSAIALVTAHVILSYWWVSSDPGQWRWTISAILGHPADFHQTNSWFSFVIPAFVTSIWLWLYIGSGFLIKAARRFDIGFQWFNRRFDIEKKPLQSIGLVAGAVVAVLYWTAVIVSRIVG
jgi:hypothetical protein